MSAAATEAAKTLGKKRWEGRSKSERMEFSQRGTITRWPDSYKANRVVEIERELEQLEAKRRRALGRAVEANF